MLNPRYTKNVTWNRLSAYICWKVRVAFLVMKLGRYVTVDDDGNYVTFHELNVRMKIKK